MILGLTLAAYGAVGVGVYRAVRPDTTAAGAAIIAVGWLPLFAGYGVAVAIGSAFSKEVRR